MKSHGERLGDVRLLDVTLRDGGYVNQHSWSIEQAASIVKGCVLAGIENIEVGYFRPDRHEVDGATAPAASSPPEYLEALRPLLPETSTLTLMVHMKEVRPDTAYRQLADQGVGMVRLACQLSTVMRATSHVEAAHEAGLRTSINLVRVSEVGLDDIRWAAGVAARARSDFFYIADSNGSLFPRQVTEVVQAARQGAGAGMEIGFHGHDGLSLAFSNSLAAVRAGARYVDASLRGMGKGGGNLSMVLIAGYLRSRAGQPLDITPLARTSADVLAQWMGANSMVEHEAVVSGLLDLNVDQVETVRNASSDDLTALLNAAPERAYSW